jgi:hypothetical protein
LLYFWTKHFYDVREKHNFFKRCVTANYLCESGETCKTVLGQSKVNVSTIPFNSRSKVCFLQVQSRYLIATPHMFIQNVNSSNLLPKTYILIQNYTTCFYDKQFRSFTLRLIAEAISAVQKVLTVLTLEAGLPAPLRCITLPVLLNCM